jgi:hypothetical protein
MGSMAYLTLAEAAARSGESIPKLRRWARRWDSRFAYKKLDEADASPMEKWFISEQELERVLGRRLRPDRFELGNEIKTLVTLLESSIDELTRAGASPNVLRDLTFAAQVAAELRAELYPETRPS